jgi:hypothetical protein
VREREYEREIEREKRGRERRARAERRHSLLHICGIPSHPASYLDTYIPKSLPGYLHTQDPTGISTHPGAYRKEIGEKASLQGRDAVSNVD